MNIAVWLVIAMVCFVLPAAQLTDGGRRAPKRAALERYAAASGLPLTDAVVAPVVARLRRRERGMPLGGLAAIVLGGLAAILIEGSDTWGALVIALAGAGTAFGGAVALASHRPDPRAEHALVARPRAPELADYLTRGERFGLWIAPVALLVAIVPGILLFQALPVDVRGASVLVGLIGTGIALVTWALAMLMLRRVLAAPARSGSDLELAWDDAERAAGLRQVANLVVAVASIAIGVWIVLMAQALTATGFYREQGAMPLTYALAFGALLAAGPIRAWATGERRGYEQRRLWPNGVMG